MKLDLKTFGQHMSLVSRMTGSGLVNIKSAKKSLIISAEQNGRSMVTYMAAEPDAKFEIALDKAVLDKTLKGRATLEMTVDGGTVRFSSGKAYNVELQSQAYTEPPTLDKTGEQNIDTDQQEILDAAMPYVGLGASFAQTEVLFFAEFKDGATRIGSMDHLHFVLYRTRGTPRELNLSFPISTFQTITGATGKADYSLAATSSSICAWNPSFDLVLPFVQKDAEAGLDDMQGVADAIKKANAIVNVKELCRAVESASSVCETGDPVKLLIGKKGIQVSGQSSVGSVIERLKADVRKPTEAALKPHILLDMLYSVSTEEAEIGVHEDAYFYIRTVDDDAEVLYGALMDQMENSTDTDEDD